jgi:hypothetical protein
MKMREISARIPHATLTLTIRLILFISALEKLRLDLMMIFSFPESFGKGKATNSGHEQAGGF